MKISQPSLSDSPRGQEWIRAQAEVRYRGFLSTAEQIWFDVPQSLETQISTSGDPWLTALLPLAVSLGEPVELEAPITAEKLNNAERLMATWADWFSGMGPVAIRAPLVNIPGQRGKRRVGCFFSGGVDSFYTLLHDRETTGGTIDELLFVHGADIPIDDQGWFEHRRTTLRRVANDINLPLRIIATNLRQTRFNEAHYYYLANASLLGAAGLLLAPRYERVLISSSWATAALHPAGSHPDTDPLLSNDKTSFDHYGTWTSRIQKTEFVSQDELARDNLRVCWERGREGNCGRCLKCVRTMTTLELIGALPSTSAFAADELDLDLLRRQVVTRDPHFFEYLLPYARKRGREDIAQAIETAFERTSRLQGLMLFGLVEKLREHLLLNPTARRILLRPYHWLRHLAVSINRRLK